MTPSDFPQANRTLTPPGGMANCGNLKVWTDGTQTISAWSLSDEEQARITDGADVYLFVVLGGTQPPVALEVGSPFESADLSDRGAEALKALGIGR